MGAVKIKDGIDWIGVQNPALRVFDIIMETEYGTSYNSYLVRGDKKTALIETVHKTFFDEHLENILPLCDIKKIDYIILNHTEPDHSGSLGRLLEFNPDIVVVATTPGHKYLTQILNKPYHQKMAVNGEQIDLGSVSLQFITAPMLHWPDSMFTYCPERKVLFSCDFLGAHYCEPRVFDSKITYRDKYEREFFNYYSAIFAPFKPYVLKGLEKMEGLLVDTVCTSHGPVLTETIENAKQKYREWSQPVSKAKKKIAVIYVSAYGCTRRLAGTIAQTLRTEFDFDVECHDALYSDMGQMKALIEEADGILLGTPTINQDALKPIWDVASSIDAISNKGKPAGVFGSYGWSGEGVGMIVRRLRDLKLSVVTVGDTDNGLRVNLVPSEEELEKAREYARLFATQIK